MGMIARELERTVMFLRLHGGAASARLIASPVVGPC